MKTLTIVLGIAFAIISACMIMLTKRGVSLRSLALIKPSEIQNFPKGVAEAVVHPLFPEFTAKDIVLVASDDNERLKALADEIRLTAGKRLGVEYHVASDPRNLQDCAKPCWVNVSHEKAQQLVPNEYIDQVIRPMARPFFTLNLTEFDNYDASKVEQCESEKRLDPECLTTLAIKAAQRKMRDAGKRYFFMQKYNLSDYFVFIQKS